MHMCYHIYLFYTGTGDGRNSAWQAIDCLNHCPSLQQNALKHTRVSLAAWRSPDPEGEIYTACQMDPRGGRQWETKLRMTAAVKTSSIWYLLQENKGHREAVGKRTPHKYQSHRECLSANHRWKVRFHCTFCNKQTLCKPGLVTRDLHTSRGSCNCMLQKHMAEASIVSR